MNYRFSVGPVSLNGTTLYGETTLLVPRQGVTLIAGSNGCGKTTLLNHILHNNPQNIALIAQENDLIFPHLSTEDNIMLLNPDREKLSRLLQLFGLTYLPDRDVRHLSGGEKRILSLLRMFFVDRDILFLDEPTNDLDYRSVETVKGILEELATSKALLIVTHDDRLFSLADRRYRFCDGRVELVAGETEGETVPLPESKPVQKPVSRLISQDLVGNFLFALLILTILCSGVVSLVSAKDKADPLLDGQTNFASKFYGNPARMIEEGYLPLEAYKAYEGKVDMEFLKVYRQTLTEAGQAGGSLNLFLDDSMGERVYLGAFLEVKTNQITYVFQDYQRKRARQTGVEPDLSQTITLFDGVHELADLPEEGVREPIDDALYRQLLEEYTAETTDLQPVLYVVMGLDPDRLNEVEGNLFIKNNTTVDICNSIQKLSAFLDSAKVLLAGLTAGLLLYFLYLCINARLHRKQTVVLRNLGVSREAVRREMVAKKGTLVGKTIMLAAGITACTVAALCCPEQRLVLLALALVCGVVGLGVLPLTCGILTKTVESVYEYGGIYEDQNKRKK